MQYKLKTKFFLLLTALVLIFSCQTIDKSQETVTELVILHTNDTHGHPLKFDNYPDIAVGGIPARATLVSEIRKEYKNVLVLDAGDLNTGRPESNFFKAEPDILGFNYIGYDAMVLGNHELDNSLDILAAQAKSAHFTFLAANVKIKTGTLPIVPYIIKEFGGIKVGIFGLLTGETASLGNQDNIKNLEFTDEIAAARKSVADLKAKKADIIIALTHLGIYDDPSMGSKRIAANVEGIDLIIDGHTHTRLEEAVYVNDVPIVQSWQWGLIVGKALITIKNKKIENFTWEPIPVNLKETITPPDGTKTTRFIGTELKEDEVILQQLQPYADQVEQILGETIGTATDVFLNKESRLNETALGDLVSDSMLWYTANTGADFALNNGGGIRTDIPTGEIKKKTIYTVIPFDNSVTVVTLSGADVLDLFKYIASIKRGAGAFPQVSGGVSFTINYGTQQCENILINGAAVDTGKKYKITTNSYLAAGGDGYTVFKKAEDFYDTSKFQRDVLIEYITHLGGTISPRTGNRITVLAN